MKESSIDHIDFRYAPGCLVDSTSLVGYWPVDSTAPWMLMRFVHIYSSTPNSRLFYDDISSSSIFHHSFGLLESIYLCANNIPIF